MQLFKATHFFITPHAGIDARGFGFSKSPQSAIRLAKQSAEINLARWDNANGHCSSIGGEVTNLLNASNGKLIKQILDL